MIFGQMDEEMNSSPVLAKDDVTLEELNASGLHMPLAFPAGVTALTSSFYAQHSKTITLTMSSSL